MIGSARRNRDRSFARVVCDPARDELKVTGGALWPSPFAAQHEGAGAAGRGWRREDPHREIWLAAWCKRTVDPRCTDPGGEELVVRAEDHEHRHPQATPGGESDRACDHASTSRCGAQARRQSGQDRAPRAATSYPRFAPGLRRECRRRRRPRATPLDAGSTPPLATHPQPEKPAAINRTLSW